MAETHPRSMRRNWQLPLGLGIVAVLLWWLFRDLDPARVWDEIRNANVLLLLLTTVVTMGAFVARAVRWRYFLAPAQPASPFRSRFAGVCVGFMLNNLLPSGRVGELGRAYAYSRLEPVSVSTAVATLVVERLLDGVAILTLLVLAITGSSFPVETLPPNLVAAIRLVTAFLGVVLVAAVLLVAFPGAAVRICSRVAGRLLPDRLGAGLAGIIEGVVVGLASMRGWRHMLPALLWSFVVWTIQSLSFWIGFRAFDIDLPFAAALVTNAAIAVAVTLPAAPGVSRDLPDRRLSRSCRDLQRRERAGARLRCRVAPDQLLPHHPGGPLVHAAPGDLAEGVQRPARGRHRRRPARESPVKPRPGGRVSVKCPAKINLFLRIVAREDSGYHQIETLFQAIDLFDRVDVYPALQGIELEVRGGEASSALGDLTAELGQPANNTVVHAAPRLFRRHRHHPGRLSCSDQGHSCRDGAGRRVVGRRGRSCCAECTARNAAAARRSDRAGRRDWCRCAFLLRGNAHRPGVGPRGPVVGKPATSGRSRGAGNPPHAHLHRRGLPRAFRQAGTSDTSGTARKGWRRGIGGGSRSFSGTISRAWRSSGPLNSRRCAALWTMRALSWPA